MRFSAAVVLLSAALGAVSAWPQGGNMLSPRQTATGMHINDNVTVPFANSTTHR